MDEYSLMSVEVCLPVEVVSGRDRPPGPITCRHTGSGQVSWTTDFKVHVEHVRTIRNKLMYVSSLRIYLTCKYIMALIHSGSYLDCPTEEWMSFSGAVLVASSVHESHYRTTSK